MQYVTSQKVYTKSIRVPDTLRGFKVHISKKHALLILNNMTSAHTLMLYGDDNACCYFIISNSDSLLFSFMVNTYNAPYEIVPVDDINCLYSTHKVYSMPGNNQLANVLS